MKTKSFARPFAIKGLAEDGTFSGYGSVAGVEDSYGDVVEAGAFSASLDAHKAKGTTPKMLWQHRASEPIGVWTKLVEDDKGLYVEGRLVLEVTQAREAYALMKAGALDGLSIGYSIPKGGGEWDPKSETFRLKQVDLWEVSPVSFPANPDARIESVKCDNPRDFEHQLRDVLGLTQAQAKRLMAGGFKALATRDVDDDALNAAKNETLSAALRRLRGA